ncbi:MAG TPA: hypothetical protein VK211_20560 [Kamptonema sp.]|nr:hypothetical protein [Kamptonema sp.]
MKNTGLLILYLIPLALLLGFVASFSVNVPFHDQWHLVSFFEKIAAKNITFGDFWALHSNHRIVFPKLIIAILAFISKWNINYELCLSICLSVITFITLYQLSFSQAKNKGDSLFHLANILTCIWVFSLVQHENWLWGFQLAWFLVNLCVVIAIFVLNLDNKLWLWRFDEAVDVRTAKAQRTQREEEEKDEEKIISLNAIGWDGRLSIAAICCGISSFSLAQGLLSWLAVIPSVVSVKGSAEQIRKRLAIWMILFAATCALYSIDYHPKREFSIISLLEKPLVIVNYFLNLLGSPIVRLPFISGVVGLLIFSNFLFFLVYYGIQIHALKARSRQGFQPLSQSESPLKRTINDSFSRLQTTSAMRQGLKSLAGLLRINGILIIGEREAVPWLSLGLFSVLSAVFITVGRARFGANHAIESSRYTTVSIFLLIAIIQLWLVFNRGKQKEEIWRGKPIYRLFTGLLICIILINSQQAIAQSQAALTYRKSGKICLELIHYLDSSNFFDNSPDSCLWVLTDKTQLVRKEAASLEKLGFRKFARNVAFITNPRAIYGYLDNPQTIEKPLIVKKSGTVRVAGWAFLPEKLEQANIALLSYGNNKSFFANAYVNLDSPDIAKALNSSNYQRVRWAVTFLANSLPVGETIISAWVYNSDGNEFVKLNGGAKVTVEEE